MHQTFKMKTWNGLNVRRCCHKQWIWLLRALWITILLATETGGRSSSALLPFIGDEIVATNQDRAGCYMDGIFHQYGDRWSPVFEPQGLMVCIKCECLSITKKEIPQTRGKIVCRNIKDLCPVPTCDQPVLRPGRCCKSCEKDDFESTFTFRRQASLPNDIYSFDAADATQPREFQALLTGRNVIGRPVGTKAVAFAYIKIMETGIQFALRYSRLDRPKYFKLMDLHGNVLFEKPIHKAIRGERKVCDAWTKVPTVYLGYVRQGKLYAVITTSTHPDGIVAGKITPVWEHTKEIFSAILNPARPDGYGAVVKLDYTPERKLASYTFHLENFKDSWKERGFEISILKGAKVLHKIRGSNLPQSGKLSGSWRVSKRRHRKQLARARLRIRITFADKSSLKGVIQPRLLCGVFQAVLTNDQTRKKLRSSAAGNAVITLGDDGRLDYSIQVSSLSQNITRIHLEDPPSKPGRQSKTVGNLFRDKAGTGHHTFEKWTNGTYRKLEAQDVVHLLNSQLFMNIATTRSKINELRGRLMSLEYYEHFRQKAIPVSFVPVSKAARGGAVYSWVFLESCTLHFDTTVVVSGKKAWPITVLLASYKNDKTVFLHKPVGKVKVHQNYRRVSGDAASLPDDLLYDLSHGDAFIQVNTKHGGRAIYIGNVTIANTCWRYSNDVDMAKDGQTDMAHTDYQDSKPMCNFEGHLYEEGSTWLPDVNATCTTCSCVAGRIVCHAMICPVLTCESPVIRDDECCPSCPHEDASETCQLGKDPRKYRVHSVWHPYLPMEGFTKCAICRCLPGSKVECDKLPCPVPNCPKAQWVKRQTDPCCYECGPNITTEIVYDEPQQDINMDGACSFADHIKADGETWHPTVHPFGYMKCFLCKCQQGTIHCGRITCPELSCIHRVKKPNSCCEECDASKPQSDQKVIPIQGTGERKNTDVGCNVAGTKYKNRQRWRPKSSPVGNGECAVCRCEEGTVSCRLRCPRICKKDASKDACCKHCGDRMKRKTKADDLSGPYGVHEQERTPNQKGLKTHKRQQVKEKSNKSIAMFFS